MANEPSLQRVWVHDNANALAQLGSASLTNQRTMRLVFADLVAAGLVVDYMSDSVAAGTLNDGVNRWDADGDLVWAAPGVAHSWAVLKLPAGMVTGGVGRLLIDLDDATAANARASVFLSFAGFTGGTITNRPTAADEFEITSTAAWVSSANGDRSWHIQHSADGAALRMFVYSSNISADNPNGIWILDRAADPPAAWLVPVVGAVQLSDTGTAANSSGWMGGTGLLKGRHSGATINVTITSEANDTDLLQQQTPATDLDGKNVLYSCGLFHATHGTLGAIRDLYFGHDSIAAFTTYPSTGRRWVHHDEMVIPNDGTNYGGPQADAKVSAIFLSGATGALISATPASGSELAATFESGRWIPIVIVLTVPDGFAPLAHCFCGTDGLWHVAYRGDDFSPLFEEHSTVSQNGTEWTLSLLPLGGWWDEPTVFAGIFQEVT